MDEVVLSFETDDVDTTPLEMVDAVPVEKPVPWTLVDPLPYGAEEERATLEEAGEVPVELTPVEREMGAVPEEEVKIDAVLEVLFVNGADDVEPPAELKGAVPLLCPPVESEIGAVPDEEEKIDAVLEVLFV